MTLLAIAIGAALGALLRWRLGVFFNPFFPTLPLGTLCANIVGAFLIGIMMAFTKDRLILSETIRLGIVTGFLGGLTTFSTFSAETLTLFFNGQYVWTGVIIVSHLFGSLIATTAGFGLVRALL